MIRKLFRRRHPHWRVRFIHRSINYVWVSGNTTIHFLPPFPKVMKSPDGRDALQPRWYLKYLLPIYKQHRVRQKPIRFIDTGAADWNGGDVKYSENDLKFI